MYNGYGFSLAHCYYFPFFFLDIQEAKLNKHTDKEHSNQVIPLAQQTKKEEEDGVVKGKKDTDEVPSPIVQTGPLS